MRKFTIQTLSDGANPAGQTGGGGGGMDPVTIITGGVALISQLFPNLFGSNRTRLTAQFWQQYIPGNGTWTTRLRNYLAAHINYDTNLNNVEPFTAYFVDENSFAICGRPNLYRGSYENVSFPSIEGGCLAQFYSLLRQEQLTGGNSPVGNVAGGVGTPDWNTLLIVGGVFAGLYLLSKKKRRGRRK